MSRLHTSRFLDIRCVPTDLKSKVLDGPVVAEAFATVDDYIRSMPTAREKGTLKSCCERPSLTS
jgi:hypothetical protein